MDRVELFNGIQVFESYMAIVRVAVRRSKNKRQQKKFIKQFGYRYEPGCLQILGALYVHPHYKLKEQKWTAN